MKLITLKPLTPFFFGYNETFGKKGTNYYVKSALFPQQSAILGMLRREILVQLGFLTRKIQDEWVDLEFSNEAKKYVGSGKFKNFDDEIDLGKIKSISPVFLVKNDEFYFLVPDIKKAIKKIQNEYFIDFGEKGYKGFDFVVKHYKNDGKYQLKDVFIPYEMSGNSKKDEMDSFYKKIAYKLNDFEFAFLIDCDIDIKDSVVKLGADSSMFKMNIKDVNFSFDDIEITKYFDCDEKVYLVVGDSYIKNLNADFGITKEITFKSIKHYAKGKKQKFKKYDSVNLYAKGSLFINFKNSLKEFPKKIGFNYIKELK
jgi:CRISPR-associated protein Cmr3